MVLGRNSNGVARATTVTYRRFAGRASLSAAVVAFMLLALGLTASSALATTGHISAGQVGFASATDPGGFGPGGPNGVVVDQASGDVFVSDPGHTDSNGVPIPRIERFDSTGTPQGEFPVDPTYNSIGTLAIDPTGGPDLYVGVADGNGAGQVLKYSTTGTPASPLALDPTGSDTAISNPSSIAVDPTDGTVYVSATDNTTFGPVIDVFDAAGVYQTKFDGSANSPDGAFSAISSLAVDSQGRLYVVDGNKGRVDRYDDAGTFQTTVEDSTHGSPLRVTADTSNDEVYVLEAGPNGNVVSWFSAGGAARLETFGTFLIGNGTAVAVNETSGTVYVSDNANSVVQAFATFAGPTVTTGGATSIDANNETLDGTINPENDQANYHFEYGLDPNFYGNSTPDVDAGNGGTDVMASATATPLTPNTIYHYRLVGTRQVNGNTGSIYGEDQTFTTAPAPPIPGAGAAATPIAVDGATLNGSVDPQGSATSVSFEYGLDTTYGTTTSNPETIGFPGAQGDTPVTPVPITGLQPGTTYHFRLLADNGTGGVQHGPDQTFTTAPAGPAGATSVTGVTAALTGAVNAPANPSTYVFQYGTDPTAYSSATAPKSVSGTTVTSNIAGLTPGTTYHVRVVVTDTVTGAVTNGVDGTFTTDPAPAAATGAVTGVSTDHATFAGTIDTHGLGGTYQFVVESSTSPYLGNTAPQTVAAGAAAGVVSGTLTDLLPGQTYTVRIVVTSSGVTTLGDAVTFSTAPLPPVAPPPPPPAASANPYGCGAPVLAAYNQHPKPGDTITVTGADLGVGGTVVLGGDTLTPTFWGVTGFTVTLPDDAKGTLPLTVNCGTVSNTIAVAMYQAPSNTVTASGKVKGTTATVKVKVPGPGSISIRSGHVKTATKHASKAATYSVTVKLNATAVKSLKRHKTLAVSLSVRFTPTGGTTGTKTVKVTFKR